MRAHPPGPTKAAAVSRFARRGGHRDVAAEANDVAEFQLLGQHPVQLLVAEPALGYDAHLDVARQSLSQADKHLIFIVVPPVLES